MPQAGRAEASPDGPAPRTRGAFHWWAVGLAAAAGLFVAWQARHALLMIFAGLLLAVLLDAGVRGLRRYLPIGRMPALLAVCLVLLALVAGAITWGGYQLVTQADTIIRLISEQVEEWRSELQALGVEPREGGENESDAQTVARFLAPDGDGWFAGVGFAFATTFGFIGDALIVIFIAIFGAANPGLYRAGVLSLAPPVKRSRLGEVLDEAAAALRYWMLGQLFAMALIGVTTWLALMLIGVPGPGILGLQAGLLAFVYYLGPLAASLPIAIVALAEGFDTFLWAMVVYFAIQTIEGHLITPLIQERAVHLPPLFTLAAIIIFGVLFGIVGIVLATPLAVVIRTFVLRLYVEDTLGGPAEQRDAEET